MSNVTRIIGTEKVARHSARGIGDAAGGRDLDAQRQFLQKLVLVGLIRPRTEELKRVILISPPTGPEAA